MTSSRACSPRRWTRVRSSPRSASRSREGGLHEVQAAGLALRAGRRVRRQGTAAGVRVAVTGAGAAACSAPRGLEAALAAKLRRPAALAGVKVSANGLNTDLHGSAEYRAAPDPGAGPARGRLRRCRLTRNAAARPAAFLVVGTRRVSRAFGRLTHAHCPPASTTPIDAPARRCDYVADRSWPPRVFLALKLQRPLFLEGEPGIGKTEIAKTLAQDAGPAADSPAVLRRAGPGAVRPTSGTTARQMMEIRLAEADAAGRPTTRGARAQEASTQRPLPDPTRRCCRRSTRQRRAAGAADRRARPRRRALRGLPARGAVGLPDHHSRDRHRASAQSRRSSSSPATARARSTTPSSAAASTTGSTFPTRHASSRSCSARVPGRVRSSWSRRSSPSCRSCARSSSTSCRASPRPSSGRAR